MPLINTSHKVERRKLGNTDLELPVISYGASSLGQEFRRVTIEEALRSCRVALELGMNFIDTSPFYGRGMSAVSYTHLTLPTKRIV